MTEAKVHVRPKIAAGRIVHVVLKHGRTAGECRPGLVIRTQDPENQILRVETHLDPFLDDFEVDRVLSLEFNPTGKPGTWHWPTECPVK